MLGLNSFPTSCRSLGLDGEVSVKGNQIVLSHTPALSLLDELKDKHILASGTREMINVLRNE